ncbi:No apical meristem-associated C-terminal domain-containing protein [Plasmodiophora brassicae]|uniref:No apical meristem-associated C-terminal domain-containing protein n=1 Tax=Plasmodiophora brassicae TaxID=37360 RepID=A0A0G4IK11_PLABS|nr:hypothetical protein PBRA_004161 [Plasmodiophora brassicae]SPR00311.1 unnamed protein product [Plasmodiophora brassicae]
MQGEANRLEGESRRTRGTNARGTNFTDAEDVQLVRSWLHASQDPATGTGQSEETFWERVEVHFRKNTTSGARTARSLQTKWGTIQRDVSKFVGSYASAIKVGSYASVIKALDESGTNEEEQIEKALTLYQQTHPKDAKFAYLHCWHVLRSVPKWQDLRHRPESNNTPSKKRRQLDSNGDIVEVDTMSSSKRRPIGVKAFMAVKAQKSQAAEQAVYSTYLKIMAKKARIQELQTNMSLFAMDMSVLDPDARKYIKLARQQALKDMERTLSVAPADDVVENDGVSPAMSIPTHWF